MLLTVEEVREYTQSEAASLDDGPIQILCNAVTREFAKFTEREFEPSDGEEVRTFLHPGGKWIDLAPFDLRSVSEVLSGIEGEASATVTGYGLRPLPADDGVFQRIKLSTPLAECEVMVKGEWGFAEIPDDVKHLALATVTIWAKREIEVFERVYNVDSSYLERPRELPAAVEGGLTNYKRVVLP
jgi:hypothetical protein